MNRKSAPLLIGELAALAGVKPDSVRFYERSGLLPKPTRLESGYRVYDDDALRRLRFIKQAQSLGFSLDEIKRILNLRGQGVETCRCVVSIAEATLSDTQEKLRELHAFHDRLKRAVADWKKSTARRRKCHAEFCDLIEQSAGKVTPARRSEAPERRSFGCENAPLDSGVESKG